ncbi:hypothetical protein E4K63_05730 [Allofrancisella inopinata]|uniref:Uncharacterized protein n=1 Tax=Allofrancisella inopinata TaxID=1085647 RepID=A0AAE6YIQ1_9GAMM|nr:hypothetical protein [Allofrancisella inopinata]QIV96351.1 hypothetical protein E4K63_05730 [Allofrancisella inopinata]
MSDHYKGIALALQKVKSIYGIETSIILPQYVRGGYWAKGFNQGLKLFIDNNQDIIDDVTFMLGQGITASKKDPSEPTKQMNNIYEQFNYLDKNKITALFNYKRTLEEGFAIEEATGESKAADTDRLIEVTNILNKEGYAGVQFWGMTNSKTAKIDPGFYDLYKTVNKVYV